ncbi:MAG: dephospho-CoA kinase [Erysipelotrichaceae bacterium]|nr:dephospho-CoA kinase [Erysipelotrichaceae bacterium]
MVKKIAITGTIASGKSTFCNIIRQMGYPVFDSDNYAKLVYHKNNPIYNEIVKLFKEEILDENREINLKIVAKIIFENEYKRKELEKLIHPFVLNGINNMIEKSNDFFFAEVPLLFESGFDKYFDEIILVTCDKEIALERCIKDRGYTKEEALSRLNSQIDAKYKIERADYVVYNNGTISDLKKSTRELILKIGG